MQSNSPPILESERPHVANYTRARLDVQALGTPPNYACIMLGDSLIEQGLWSEWLGPKWLNRGIGSATIALVESRVHEIVSLHPAQVNLMVGVNDLNHGMRPDQAALQIAFLLRSFKGWTDLTWLTILPVDKSFKDDALNPLIAETNHLVTQLIQPDQIKIIDLWSVFAEDGVLPNWLTYDGVHLNGAGYQLFLERLQ